MTDSNQRPLSVALGHYRRSDAQVRLLKARLPKGEVHSIVQEVLERVKAETRRNNRSIDSPSRQKIERLCHALIAADPNEGQTFIECIHSEGASLDTIYLSYLAAAAALLGEWWNEDAVSFHDVAIGTSRIYSIVRGLSCLFVPPEIASGKSAVFAAAPGESHVLGVQMASDLFTKQGWNIHLILGKNHDDLVTEISSSRCPIIGLSASGEQSVSALVRLVVALRISNPWARIVLSGQIAHVRKDVLDAVDVDAVVADVDQATETFDHLFAQSIAHNDTRQSKEA